MNELQIVNTLNQLVLASRLDLSNEKYLQSDLDNILNSSNISYEREFHLSVKDIVDFMLNDSIAVECKLKGQNKKSIYRQLYRYAAYPAVKAVVLVTNIAMGLPQTIDRKPLYYISLNTGWM